MRRALSTIDDLLWHERPLGEAAAEEIRRSVLDIEGRLSRRGVTLVVVGEKKAGKSTFLNALLGARLLGTAARECTGTVTFIRSAPCPAARAMLVDGRTEWIDGLGDGFADRIRDLTDMARRGREVRELHIEYPTPRIPADFTVIDTPGVNSEDDENRERAWRVIRREADGCVLLSDLQQAVSRSTRAFIEDLRKVVPHLILVLTKHDRALENARGTGDQDAESQVGEALHVGVRRFARQIGRTEETVFALHVAAEAALRAELAEGAGGREPETAGARPALDFDGDAARLFELVLNERASLLGARSAGVLSRAIEDLRTAEATAVETYRERIRILEAQRIPDPARFRRDQRERVKTRVTPWTRSVARLACRELERRFAAQETLWVGQFLACSDASELGDLGRAIEASSSERLSEHARDVDRFVAAQLEGIVHDMELVVFEDLKNRYRIARETSPASVPLSFGSWTDVAAFSGASAETSLVRSVRHFELGRLGVSVGAAAAGAVIGNLMLPGFGGWIGALVGSNVGHRLVPVEHLRRRCIERLGEGLRATLRRMQAELSAADGLDLAILVHERIAEDLDTSLERYQHWIAELLVEERERIAREKRKLHHLEDTREALENHRRRLADLEVAAEAASLGLCRRSEERSPTTSAVPQ